MTTIVKTTSSGGKVRITTPAAAALPNALGADPMAALVAAVTTPAPAPAPAVDPMAAARAIFAAGLADVQKTSDRWTTDYASAMN